MTASAVPAGDPQLAPPDPPEPPSPSPPAPAGLSGAAYMALGAFFFSWMTVGVKFAGAGVPSAQVVLVRGVITLLLSFWMVRQAGAPMLGERRGFLLLRGVLGFLALQCFYYSVTRLPLADATLLQYTNPVWTAVLAALFLSERMGRRELACVGASLIGTALIVRPQFLFGGAGIPGGLAAIALLGALFSAGSYTTIRLIRGEHPLTVVFLFPLVTVPAALPFALRSWVWPTATEWFWLAVVGVCTQAAQIFMTRGLQRERAGRATAIGYLQVVFAMAWGVLLFGEALTPWQIAGSALILASTLLLSRPAVAEPE